MLRVDGASVEGEGDINQQLSELTVLVHAIVQDAEDKAGLDYATTMDSVVKRASLYKLTDTGMTLKEAIEVLGINPDSIDKKRTVLPDGETL